MATVILDSVKVNLYRLLYTLCSVRFTETRYNWTNHFVVARPHNITSDCVIYAAICGVSLELTECEANGKILHGQKNVLRAMNWCFEAGVLRLAKNGVFF